MTNQNFHVSNNINKLQRYLVGTFALTEREIIKFFRQRERMLSAIVRPSLWLFIFAVGSQNLLGISIIEPYETYTTYQEYILPGLLGIILLFQSMQSALSLVYDREAGVMKVMLMSPLPRSILLFGKIIASTILSIIQIYVFLGIAFIFGISFPTTGYIFIIPAIFICGVLLGAIGLSVTLYSNKIENFAGMMNFVVFPMFFLSSALYPLWTLKETGSQALYIISKCNPFTHVVELIRFSAYAKLEFTSLTVILFISLICFLCSVYGYDVVGRSKQ